MKCEYCDGEAKYIDQSAIDTENSGRHQGELRYKAVYLCIPHAIEAREVNTSRVELFSTEYEYDDERIWEWLDMVAFKPCPAWNNICRAARGTFREKVVDAMERDSTRLAPSRPPEGERGKP